MLAASIARGGAPTAIAAPGTGPVLTGLTAPGGPVWIGTHLWIPDGTLGFCRVDTTAAGSLTITAASCDTQAKNPASAVLDPRPIPGWPNTVDRYMYIADVSFKALGVMRVVWQASTETIVPGSGKVLAGGSNQSGLRPDAVALGPDGNVYVGFKKHSSIVRISGATTTGTQTAVVISQTSDGRKGVAPGGLAFITYTAPAAGVTHGDLYVANSPGSAPGIIVRYNPATQAETVFATGGQLPVGGTPTTLVRCQYTSPAENCARSEGSLQDGLLFAPSAQEYPFRFILAMYVDPQGNLHFGDDPYAGSRAQHGHSWVIPSVATIP